MQASDASAADTAARWRLSSGGKSFSLSVTRASLDEGVLRLWNGNVVIGMFREWEWIVRVDGMPPDTFPEA